MRTVDAFCAIRRAEPKRPTTASHLPRNKSATRQRKNHPRFPQALPSLPPKPNAYSTPRRASSPITTASMTTSATAAPLATDRAARKIHPIATDRRASPRASASDCCLISPVVPFHSEPPTCPAMRRSSPSCCSSAACRYGSRCRRAPRYRQRGRAAPETRGGNNRRAPPARDRREARLRHMTPPARRHALSVQPRRA